MAQIEQGKIVSVRAAPPGSYMFRIQSFSSMTEFDMARLNIKSFDSPEFESCGHKWILSVHPYGDKKQGVRGHVSFYLVSTDDETESVGSEINVAFKMFVYDHIRDNFLTVQDAEVRRFHRLKKEWGFAHLISHERFKDARNGYLQNDCCLFGVEICVLPTLVYLGHLELHKELKDGIFTWKLNHYSTLGHVVRFSDIFRIQGHQWKLAIYPECERRVKPKHLSLFLELRSLDPHGYSTVSTEVVMSLKNHLSDNDHTRTFFHCFDHCFEDFGFTKFILLEDLKNKSKGFILDDSVTLVVEVKCMLKKHFSK